MSPSQGEGRGFNSLPSLKISGRQVYQDSFNHQISSLAGTIFEKSSTPLQYWLCAIFIMAVIRSGVSAKQLQRELGVTYKTAWRMFQQIRKLIAQDSGLLNGTRRLDYLLTTCSMIPSVLIW